MPLSSWTFGVFSKSGTAQGDGDKDTSEISMPGAWDSTPKSQPLSRSVPQTPAASNSEEEDDSVPAFPALNSIQRSGFSRDVEPEPPEPSPSIRVLADDDDAKLMPPPTFLPPRAQQTGSGLSARGNQQSSLSSPSSLSSSSLLVPLSTRTVPPNTNTKKSARAKVALAPGHSPLDWAHLKSSGEDLRGGITQLMRIPPSELREHRMKEDAWAAFSGKVYNITPFLPFHPGGEKELMRVAGRDGTKLFALTHSWVNLDFMLDGCMIGFLAPEDN